MKNRIHSLFDTKKEQVLSVYFTAGYPEKDSTVEIIKSLDNNGIDLIEVGFPFSDPLADGPVIQESSKQALDNGMSLEVLFEQLATIREHTQIPLVLMGVLKSSNTIWC